MIAVVAIHAQAPPAFEVASIKPGDVEALRQGRGALARSDPGRSTISLRDRKAVPDHAREHVPVKIYPDRRIARLKAS